jgi:nitrogen regulatory protein P-II 1
VEIIIRPEKLELLKRIPEEFNIGGMTVLSVMGCGNQKGTASDSEFKGLKIPGMNLIPKIMVIIVMKDKDVNRFLRYIYEQISENRVGDGKVFVSEVENVMRIRTGERGGKAL